MFERILVLFGRTIPMVLWAVFLLVACYAIHWVLGLIVTLPLLVMACMAIAEYQIATAPKPQAGRQ